MTIRWFLSPAIVAIFAVCAGQSAAQQVAAAEPAGAIGRDTACYRLTYSPAPGMDTDGAFADYAALGPGPDRPARSGTERPSEFWRMFLVGGSWQRRGDTLEITFTNGFSGVRYLLAPAGGSALSGQVWFLYDVVDQRPPPVPVAASAIACSHARIQSPPADPALSKALRAERAREEFVARETERVRRISSPVAGTYEFEVSIPGAPPLRLYGRTDAHPATPLWETNGGWEHSPPDDGAPPRARGYQLRMAVTRSLDELPLAFGGQSDRGRVALAYFSMAEQPEESTSGGTTWSGRFDVSFAASRLIQEQPLDSLLMQSAGQVSDVWGRQAPGSTVGRLTVRPDGQATATMQVHRRGVEVLSVRGVRISGTTLEPRDPERR